MSFGDKPPVLLENPARQSSRPVSKRKEAPCALQNSPGYRRLIRLNRGVAESLIAASYAVPFAILNPRLAGGFFVDYLVRRNYRLVPKSVQVLSPGDLSRLTVSSDDPQNAASAGVQAPRSAV